jgi:hypothetical protein
MTNDPLEKRKPRQSKAATVQVAQDKAAVAHIMIRVRSEDGMTIASHKSVIALHGKVLFAKIGKGLSVGLASILNQQIQAGTATHLFIATFDGWKQPFAIYQCNLGGVYAALDKDLLQFVPNYMKGNVSSVGTWLEISSLQRVSQDEVKRIHIFTSGREVSGSLRGATAMFKVGISGPSELKKIPDTPPKVKASKLFDEPDEDLDLYSGDDYGGIADWKSS